MSQANLLEVTDLRKHFRAGSNMFSLLDKSAVRAVDGVSFTLNPGETLSVVGESGCGKTTVARLVLGLEQATSGTIRFEGQDITARKSKEARRDYRLAVQAVFQDPTSALNPKRRIGDIIGEPLLVNTNQTRQQRDDRVAQLLRDVGLDAAVATAFPHELSGGMRQRVAIAQALALNPRLIVLDEPVSALDVSIRAQIMNLLKDLQNEHGVAFVMIAHDLGTVRYLSHKVMAMYVGEVVETGPSEAVFDTPLHPYTIALISAVSISDDPDQGHIILGGETASPIAPPTGCRFHPRCWLAKQLNMPAQCTGTAPALINHPTGQQVACHFSERLADRAMRKAHLAAARADSADLEE